MLFIPLSKIEESGERSQGQTFMLHLNPLHNGGREGAYCSASTNK